MKRLLVIILSLGLCLAVAGCGSESREKSKEPEKPLDLSGKWVQSNSDSDDMWHEAIIKDDEITIHWVSNDGDTKDLYWAGSYVAPTEPGDTYSWESENDTSKTDMALLASTSKTKEFTYENDELVYEASAMGSDMTIRLKKGN